MPWFAAHAIVYLKAVSAPQDSFLVWENVHLIEAADFDEAWVKAEARAALDADPNDTNTRLEDGTPARWTLGGVRKVISVAHLGPDDRLTSGDELSYTQFELQDEQSIKRLVKRESVPIVYLAEEDPESHGGR